MVSFGFVQQFYKTFATVLRTVDFLDGADGLLSYGDDRRFFASKAPQTFTFVFFLVCQYFKNPPFKSTFSYLTDSPAFFSD